LFSFTSVKLLLRNILITFNSLLNISILTKFNQILNSLNYTRFDKVLTLSKNNVLNSWTKLTLLTFKVETNNSNISTVTKFQLFTNVIITLPSFIQQLRLKTSFYVYTTLLKENLQSIMLRFVGVGFFYITYSCFIMYIDACLTDDEPIWEPIEWSLVQTWILFLFTFAWIAENLIVSRYGSYTGRDKRVWFAWYKTFWLMELYYIINFGAAVLLVIVPFYYETNYNISFLFSWWHWYSRVFFF
jgi:hypothetical protein